MCRVNRRLSGRGYGEMEMMKSLTRSVRQQALKLQNRLVEPVCALLRVGNRVGRPVCRLTCQDMKLIFPQLVLALVEKEGLRTDVSLLKKESN